MGIFDNIYRQVRDQVRSSINKANEYPDTDDCIELDKQIKKLDIAIADASKKEARESNKAKEFGFRATVEVLSDIRAERQTKFINKRCATEIENMKAQETAKIIGQEVSKYEDDVLTGSDKERRNLFLIGGGILIVALVTILMATRKKK